MEGGGRGRGEGERKDATREPVSVLMLHDVFFFLYCLLLVFPNHVIIQKTRSDINQEIKQQVFSICFISLNNLTIPLYK